MCNNTRGPSSRRERDGERGAIAILMAFSLTMLMGFAALGFDLSYVRLARLEMKNATDAAAHAAILILRSSSSGPNATSNSTSAGIAVAAANTVLGKPMVLTGNDFTFGNWDSVAKSFSASAPYTAVKINGIRDVSDTGGYVALTFGRALGYTTASTTQDTIGAFANRNFMIEMDITPSYFCTIDDAVLADLALLDQLHAQNIGGDRISLDVFAGVSQQMNDFLNIRDNYTSIYQLWAGGVTYSSFMGGKTAGITVCNKSDDPNVPPGGHQLCGATNYVYPNNPNTIACSTTNLTGYTSTVFAGTDIGAAIRAGTAKLQAETQTWEPRILIVVTDGMPMMCTAAQGGDLCSNNANPCCSDGWCTQANADPHDPVVGGATLPLQSGRSAVCHAAHDQRTTGLQSATDAGTAGIDLFVIKMTGSSTDNGSTYGKDLVANAIATGPGHGTFQWVTDGTQLSTAFTSVLGQVPISLVQ